MNIIVKFIIWGISFGLFFTIGYKILNYLKKNNIKNNKTTKFVSNFNNNDDLLENESNNKIIHIKISSN